MNALRLAKSRVPRAALAAMGTGLLLTMITLIALIIDQVSVYSIAAHKTERPSETKG